MLRGRCTQFTATSSIPEQKLTYKHWRGTKLRGAHGPNGSATTRLLHRKLADSYDGTRTMKAPLMAGRTRPRPLISRIYSTLTRPRTTLFKTMSNFSVEHTDESAEKVYMLCLFIPGAFTLCLLTSGHSVHYHHKQKAHWTVISLQRKFADRDDLWTAKCYNSLPSCGTDGNDSKMLATAFKTNLATKG
jgi:hypothetical protein